MGAQAGGGPPAASIWGFAVAVDGPPGREVARWGGGGKSSSEPGNVAPRPCCVPSPCGFQDQSPNMTPQALHHQKCFAAGREATSQRLLQHGRTRKTQTSLTLKPGSDRRGQACQHGNQKTENQTPEWTKNISDFVWGPVM